MSDNNKKLGPVVAILVPALLLGGILSIPLFATAALACNPESGPGTSVSIDPDTVPNIDVGGYGHDQLVNAAHIIKAGADKGLGVLGVTDGEEDSVGYVFG